MKLSKLILLESMFGTGRLLSDYTPAELVEYVKDLIQTSVPKGESVAMESLEEPITDLSDDFANSAIRFSVALDRGKVIVDLFFFQDQDVGVEINLEANTADVEEHMPSRYFMSNDDSSNLFDFIQKNVTFENVQSFKADTLKLLKFLENFVKLIAARINVKKELIEKSVVSGYNTRGTVWAGMQGRWSGVHLTVQINPSQRESHEVHVEVKTDDSTLFDATVPQERLFDNTKLIAGIVNVLRKEI